MDVVPKNTAYKRCRTMSIGLRNIAFRNDEDTAHRELREIASKIEEQCP